MIVVCRFLVVLVMCCYKWYQPPENLASSTLSMCIDFVEVNREVQIDGHRMLGLSRGAAEHHHTLGAGWALRKMLCLV